jgi:hypothetical protein
VKPAKSSLLVCQARLVKRWLKNEQFLKLVTKESLSHFPESYPHASPQKM